MFVGWTSASRRSTDRFRSSPRIITAEVVPSPHSSSSVLDTSTTILAAGCCTSRSFSMVTPSLVMVTSPTVSTIILSMPLGPRVLLTMSATVLAALMLLYWASFPRSLLVPSLRIIIGVLPIPMCLPSLPLQCASLVTASHLLTPLRYEHRTRSGPPTTIRTPYHHVRSDLGPARSLSSFG